MMRPTLTHFLVATAFASDVHGQTLLDAKHLQPFGLGGSGFGRLAAVGDGFVSVAAADRVYLFESIMGMPEAILQSPDTPFGSAYSMAADKDLAVIGNSGFVYMFRRSGAGFWSLIAKLSAQDGTIGFGSAVAIENGLLAVGAPCDDDLARNAGAVYVFRESLAGAWPQETKILNPGNAPDSDNFGTRVVTNGVRLLVSSPNDGIFFKGRAFVFSQVGGIWTEEGRMTIDTAKLNIPNGSGGMQIALGDDAAFIGAVMAPVAEYVPLVNNWVPGQQFLGFEYMVAADAGMAILGGSGNPDVFTKDLSGWTKTLSLSTTTGYQYTVGDSLHVTGNVVVWGAPSQAGGEVFLYDLASPYAPSLYCTGKLSSQGCVANISWEGLGASSTDLTPLWIRGNDLINNKNGLFFYGLLGPANLPFKGGTLCVFPPLQRTPLQTSAGNQPPDDCSGVLALDFNSWIRSGSDPALVPGASVHGQFWFRDPSDIFQTGLSNAIAYPVGP